MLAGHSRMVPRDQQQWEAGDPNADPPRGTNDVVGLIDAPPMPPYDGLVFNNFCMVCTRQLNSHNQDCGCVDYRGLKRFECKDGLFFPSLRMKNAWIVLRRNKPNVRCGAHRNAWSAWRRAIMDLLLRGHPILRTKAGYGGTDPRVGNHVRSFMEFVFMNFEYRATNDCVVCGDKLAVNRSHNFCRVCKALPQFRGIWKSVQNRCEIAAAARRKACRADVHNGLGRDLSCDCDLKT